MYVIWSSTATRKFQVFAEAAHNALDASIYSFSNDGPHFKAEIVDPKKNMAQLVTLSRHRKLCRDIVVIFVPQILSWFEISIVTGFL